MYLQMPVKSGTALAPLLVANPTQLWPCGWGQSRCLHTKPCSAATRSIKSGRKLERPGDRKSTRLNSSHLGISYAVFCLKNKSDFAPACPDQQRPRCPPPFLPPRRPYSRPSAASPDRVPAAGRHKGDTVFFFF